MTGELHAEEAKRLADGQGDLKMHIDGNQFLRMQEKTNSFEHQINQYKMEKNQLLKELENAKINLHNV